MNDGGAGGDGTSPPVLAFACLGFVALLLAAHVAVLRQGQWFDEYFTFSFLRAWGFAGVMIRLRHWGMRPFSELLAYGYCQLVLAAGRPLITPVLGFAWGILFGFLAAAIRPWRRPARTARWAMLLALPVLFLLAGPVGELWYWPLASLAYLPALGAACYATMAIVGPGLDGGLAWLGLSAALTVGAASAELGAFMALLLSPLLFLDLFVRGGRGSLRHAAMIGVPFMVASFVMLSLVFGRAASPTEMVLPGTFHRAWPSLAAAAPHLAADLAGAGDTVWDTLRTLAGRALLLAGSWMLLGRAWPAPVTRLRVAMLTAALCGTALLSMAGAYYQFGVLCCERHESYRQALYLLATVAVAGLLPRSRPSRPWLGWVPASALLAAACAVKSPPRIPALLAEYRLAPAQMSARQALFASGSNPHNDTLDMVLAPPGPLLQAYHIVPGTYSMTPVPPWFVQGPMLFFGKTRMVARRPAGTN